tara:strand:+ start:2626 stop:2940 length:315 start_codon:yes stop_codon:yes gene_type:complete
MDDTEQYVVVDTIHTFSHKYVIPISELQNQNPEIPVDPAWALDMVTCDEIVEFSQKGLGEHIIDHNVVSEEEILKLFDKHNDYLSNWNVAQKLHYIKNWKNDIK